MHVLHADHWTLTLVRLLASSLASRRRCSRYGDIPSLRTNSPSAIWPSWAEPCRGGFGLVLSHTCLPGNRIDSLGSAGLQATLKFGRWIFVSTLLTFWSAPLDRLNLRKMIPIALFGVYSSPLCCSNSAQAVLKPWKRGGISRV